MSNDLPYPYPSRLMASRAAAAAAAAGDPNDSAAAYLSYNIPLANVPSAYTAERTRGRRVRGAGTDASGRRLDGGRGEGQGREGDELPAYDKYGGPPGYLDLEAGLTGLGLGLGHGHGLTPGVPMIRAAATADANANANANTVTSESSHVSHPVPLEDAPAYDSEDVNTTGRRDGEVEDSSASPQPDSASPSTPISGAENSRSSSSNPTTRHPESADAGATAPHG